MASKITLTIRDERRRNYRKLTFSGVHGAVLAGRVTPGGKKALGVWFDDVPSYISDAIEHLPEVADQVGEEIELVVDAHFTVSAEPED